MITKSIKIIKDPEVAQLFGDETRRKILFHLRHKEMSTTELARILNKNHSSIIYHLNLLKEAGLVAETRVEQIRNMNQTFYMATSPRFMISYSLGEVMNEEGEDIPWQESMIQSTLNTLENFNYKISHKNVEETRRLINSFFLKDQKAYEEILEKQYTEISHERHYGWNAIKLLKMLALFEDQDFLNILVKLKENIKSLT